MVYTMNGKMHIKRIERRMTKQKDIEYILIWMIFYEVVQILTNIDYIVSVSFIDSSHKQARYCFAAPENPKRNLLIIVMGVVGELNYINYWKRKTFETMQIYKKKRS